MRRGVAGVAGLVCGVLMTGGLVAVSTGEASAAARHFRSCTALHHVYKHGVGRVGARDHTKSGTGRVTSWTRNTAVYRANNGPRNRATGEYDLDRDNDGIACEAH